MNDVTPLPTASELHWCCDRLAGPGTECVLWDGLHWQALRQIRVGTLLWTSVTLVAIAGTTLSQSSVTPITVIRDRHDCDGSPSNGHKGDIHFKWSHIIWKIWCSSRHVFHIMSWITWAKSTRPVAVTKYNVFSQWLYEDVSGCKAALGTVY